MKIKDRLRCLKHPHYSLLRLIIKFRCGSKILSGPFYALGPAKSYVVLTDGGLAVDEEHRLLGENDKAIPGLFAAGSVGQGGLMLKGHGHHIGWAFTSGRRAGRHAATEAGINVT